MSIIAADLGEAVKLPNHKDLPCEDGAIVQNFNEHPQAMLLSDTLQPILWQLHPDGQFAIGQDSGIYWRNTDPPLKGCVAPDWFYVPNVPPKIDGDVRRSYVMWQEREHPVLVVEFVSGDGREERDRTPDEGKFWIYERRIRAAYYAIYEVEKAEVEVYRLEIKGYRPVKANEAGRFPIPELGIELGIWDGLYTNVEFPWLRPWDRDGNLLPTADERSRIFKGQIVVERRHAAREKQRADEEQQRADREKQKAEQEQHRAEQEKQRAEQEKQRAEQEKQRADRLTAQLKAMGIDPEA